MGASMKKRFPDATEIYHLREYAILKAKDGTYEYVVWEIDKRDNALVWLSGKAAVVDDLLVLTRIVDDGHENMFKDLKETRKALKKFPDWWEKTTYYCVVVDQYATTPCLCTSGNPIKEDSEDYKRIQDALRRFRIILTPSDHGKKLRGIEKAMSGPTNSFSTD